MDGLNRGDFEIIRINQNNIIVKFDKEIGTFYQEGVPVGKSEYGTVHFGTSDAHIVPANPNQF